MVLLIVAQIKYNNMKAVNFFSTDPHPTCVWIKTTNISVRMVQWKIWLCQAFTVVTYR